MSPSYAERLFSEHDIQTTHGYPTNWVFLSVFRNLIRRGRYGASKQSVSTIQSRLRRQALPVVSTIMRIFLYIPEKIPLNLPRSPKGGGSLIY